MSDLINPAPKNMVLGVLLAVFLGGLGVFYVSMRNGLIITLMQLITYILFLGSVYWAEQAGEVLGWLLAVFFITLFIAAWIIGVICNVVAIKQRNRAVLANSRAKNVF